MIEVDVRVARTDREREDAFEVRRVVFVDEQDVDEALEWDDWDDHAATMHFVAYDADGTPVGAARLRPRGADPADQDDPTWDAGAVGKVERVAVRDSHRGTGVGRALMDAVHAHGRERGVTSFLLHSQTQAAGFYERLGYEAFGDEFVEADIPHVKMRLDA
jgi:predicted GNAT family N-acyltransferase